MNEIDNFADLIKQYSIMIPKIQRDYVQGNEADKGIRNNRDAFIKKILSSVNNNEEVDMQYIFGIRKNSFFLPIDGQQRLTTSYLICWFIAVKENRFEDFLFYTKGFTYQVRTSSEDFFAALREKKNISDFEEYCDGKKEIKKSSWFKKTWRLDNTVNNSISLLNAVRAIYKGVTVGSIFNRLFPSTGDSEKSLLRFSVIFQNTQSEDSFDDEKSEETFEIENRAAVTYINMNARGKQLTDFESMKSKFHRYEKGKKFAVSYDGKYIELFKRIVEEIHEKNKKQKNKTLNLDRLIMEMDELAKRFLVCIYFDLNNAKNKCKDKRDYYVMRKEIEERDPGEEFFGFVMFILDECNTDVDKRSILIENIKKELKYSNEKTWVLFKEFWPLYRKINLEEWNLLFRLADGFCYDKKSCDYTVIYNLVDVIAQMYEGSTMKYFSVNTVETIYEKFNKAVDKASIREIKLLSWFYMTDKEKYNELIELNKPLRHMFYICNYWEDYKDEDGSKWEKLKRYMDYDKNRESGNIIWDKFYYLNSLREDDKGEFNLPEEGKRTSYSENKVYIKWMENQYLQATSVLDNIRKCYEKIDNLQAENSKKEIDGIINDYLNDIIIKESPNRWLYHVLKEDNTELMKNRIKCENGIYLYDDCNFFVYVYALRNGWSKEDYILIKSRIDGELSEVNRSFEIVVETKDEVIKPDKKNTQKLFTQKTTTNKKYILCQYNKADKKSVDLEYKEDNTVDDIKKDFDKMAVKIKSLLVSKYEELAKINDLNGTLGEELKDLLCDKYEITNVELRDSFNSLIEFIVDVKFKSHDFFSKEVKLVQL